MNWIKAQLSDPSSLLHANGFIWLNVEFFYWHIIQGHPVDSIAVAMGLGSILVGGTIDAVQALQAFLSAKAGVVPALSRLAPFSVDPGHP